MTDVSISPAPSCGSCQEKPAAQSRQTQNVSGVQLALSLPSVHCSSCIRKIENALTEYPGVNAARVNLTLKRASVEADAGVRVQDLISLLNDMGYEAHELDTEILSAAARDKAGRELLMRLAVAGFASMNIMLLSVAVWSGATDATRDLFHWISAAIAVPAIAYSGQPFFRNATKALSKRRLNMDVPISLAILLALVTSLWETSLGGEHAYFDAAVALTFFLLAGRYLDQRTRSLARSAAQELTALEVERATRLNAGREEVVNASGLNVDDIILVRPGSRMPVDGQIVEGASELDRSFLTGETVPVFAEVGQHVAAGEVNLSGSLKIRATAVGQDTSLFQLAELVAVAESGRSRYTSLADKAAKLYAPGVHILSALAFAGWLFYTWDIRTSLNIAASVLIITCPCALGLAVPAVTTAASGRLFRKGLLIKHETALERLAQVDTVVFDKTGTLTTGQPELTNGSEISPQNMALAAALANGSQHPLAQSISRAAQKAGISPVDINAFEEVPGYGVKGVWRGAQVRLGNAKWIGATAALETATYLAIDGCEPVAFKFVDRPKDSAVEAITALKASGKDIHLLSGDAGHAVQKLANTLGIEHWRAETSPKEKAEFVQELSDKGAVVLMVGDGLNDTAALAAAHVSIAPSTALDVARVASDVVLLGGDLKQISAACDTARSATLRIRQNFRIATWYNIIAVPLAIAGLATPLVAALAMSASSITVSLNALRLR